MPVNASNSPGTFGTGNPRPGFWFDGWPNAFRLDGVSGAIALDPSTRKARSPHHSSPSADPNPARRSARDPSRSSACRVAGGGRCRASQDAAALT